MRVHFISVLMCFLVATFTKSNADTRYVVPFGQPEWPYTNWSQAATNIQTAVDASQVGDTVLVTNGTYYISPSLIITQDITVVSVNKTESTVLDGMHTNRVVWIASSNAVLDGFKITNGSLVYSNFFTDPGVGGGVLCAFGTVRNCHITGNSTQTTQPLSLYDGFGGFVCGAGGVISNCLVEGNVAENDCGGGGGWGVVADCVIRSNSAAYAGGVFVRSLGMVVNCTITDNTAQSGGGAYVFESGELANCLVAGNKAILTGGGVAVNWGGAIRNCTITGNSASNGAGVACFTNGVNTIVNTIVYGNTPDNCIIGGASFSFCCSTPAIPGVGNITNDPQFANASVGDYRLSTGSPCIDTGTSNGAPDRDLDGVPRPLDGDFNGVAAVDMGAYEFSVWETNTHYVSLNGGHQWPYTNWVAAATNIQAAVDAATGGETVMVANGTFVLTSEVTVDTNLVIRSANGALATFVDGGQATRCFRLMPDADCTLRGFTITNAVAATNESGGGVWMGSSNNIQDCIFVACTARCGGAVYANLSTVSNCSFIGNAAAFSGGGLHGDGVRALNCTFDRNVAFIGGGIIETWTGPFPAMRDCTFVGNTASCGGGACYGSPTNVSAVLTNLLPMMDSLSNIVPQLNYVQNMLTNMFPLLPQGVGAFLKGGKIGDKQAHVLSSTVAEADDPTGGDILRCIMTSNTADYGGGLFLLDTPDLITSNCVFSGNHAQSGGGVFALNAGELCESTMVGNNASFVGGGALVLGAGLLRHCNIVSNQADMAGGGSVMFPLFVTTIITPVLAASGTSSVVPRIEDSEFLCNSAGTMGGGLMLFDGIAERIFMTGNRATWGGGFANWGGSVREANVISNSASLGGGFFVTKGDVATSTLQGNSADGIGGGGIAFAALGNVTIRNSLVADNFAIAGGGIGLFMAAQVQTCEIRSNTATQAGGGVLCLSGGDVSSSLVSRNIARDGGGVYCLNGGTLINATITGNMASNQGGGICVVTNVPGGPPSLTNATVRNTIIYGNTATNGANFLNQGTNVTYSYCCTFPLPETVGEGNITNNPCLTPDNRLKSASPCIDAGTDVGAPATDMDGEARWDDPRHSNVVSIVDIGADEFVDTDLDYMADQWETSIFSSITNRNGTGDFDNDSLIDLAEYEHSTNPTNTDTDMDQLLDGWEVANGLNPLSNMGDNGTTGDPDGDGADNLTEYIADTQPTNADSVLRIFTIKPEHGGMRIDWKGGIQAWQFLDCREDLTNTNEEWLPILCLPPPTQTTNAVIDMGVTNRMFFYRIRAER